MCVYVCVSVGRGWKSRISMLQLQLKGDVEWREGWGIRRIRE